MSSFYDLNQTLSSISASSSSLLNATFDIQSQFNAAITSVLGTNINQVLGGFQALTQDIDNIADFVQNSGIVMLVENPPGVEIQKEASSLNADLEAITESTMGGGFLNLTIAANTPEAISKALTDITDLPATALNSVMQEISPAIDQFTAPLTSMLSSVETGLGLFNNFVTDLSSFTNSLGIQLPNGVTDLSNMINSAVADFENAIAPLTSSIVYVGANTPIDSFVQDATTINSSTQVQSILVGATREITTVVVSCSNTFKDQDVRASNVPGWHFLITRAGELQEVTNINTNGTIASGYNTYTIGITFAGGLNTTLKEAGGQDKRIFASSDSLTREQYNAFDMFMQSFYNVYPHGQAVGLQDISSAESPFPGFDVKAYCYERFGKTTVIDTTKPAPSISQLELQMSLNTQGVTDPGILDEPSEAV